MIRKGSKVHWLDPAIHDYPDEEWLNALNRIFTVYEIKGDIYYISDGFTEAEVTLNELEPIKI